MSSAQHLPGDSSEVLGDASPDQGLHCVTLRHGTRVPLDQDLVPGGPEVLLGRADTNAALLFLLINLGDVSV